MNIFDLMKEYGHEQIIFCYDSVSDLKAIIGIHDTTLGPALGGTRIWDYETEKEALIDVLRLSKGMTYKNAVAGLNLGGGKAVIMGDPEKIKSEELFRAFGRYIEGLGGRYITGEDMNATTKDMGIINEETDHVVGLEGKSGNPAPVTAFGVFRGILAAVEEAFGTIELMGKTIAVQGIGAVGYHLCKHLHEVGANLIVSDIKKANVDRAVKDFGATGVTPEEIYETDCDVFAPCAMGAIINDSTIEQLKCKAVAGSANNQLAENKHGEMLKERGIVYAPDFVINGAGVMNVYEEMKGYNTERAMTRAARVYDNVKKVFEIAKRDDIPTYRAADRMAEERIKKIWQITKILNNK